MLPDLEAAWSQHRHFKFNCLSDEQQGQQQQGQRQQGQQQQQRQQGQQQQGEQQQSKSLQKPVQFWSLDSLMSMQRDALFGPPPPPSCSSSSSSSSSNSKDQPPQLPSADDLNSCAFFPLPYPLPPQKYLRSDIPFTYSRPESYQGVEDSLGCVIDGKSAARHETPTQSLINGIPTGQSSAPK